MGDNNQETSINAIEDLVDIYLPPQTHDCICVLSKSDVDQAIHSPFVKVASLDPPFVISRAEGGAGMGMFASHGLSTGDLIWKERPLAIIPSEVVQDIYSRVWHHMSSSQRESSMELRNAHGQDVEPFEGVLRTNFIGMELFVSPKATSYRGLFPIISRCNHSCCSNATYHFDSDSFSLELRATRSIAIGEEIHVQYIDVILPRNERIPLLRRLYMFDCDCPSCGLDDGSDEAISSDRRRRAIGNWFETHISFVDWLYDSTIPAQSVIQHCEEFLSLVNLEGLDLIRRPALDMICAALAALSDAELFCSWALIAREAARMGGDGHPMVEHYDRTLVDPTTSHLWGARKLLNSSAPTLHLHNS